MFHPANDVPRSAPLPTSVEKLHLSPSVPEISMIFSNVPKNCSQANKETRFCIPNHLDLQKQVRFHNPPPEKQFPVFGKPVLQDKVLPINVLPQSKTKFADVYMANVPNRHLDLSMIDNCGVNRFTTQNCLQQKTDKVNSFSSCDKGLSMENITKHNQSIGVTNILEYNSNNNELLNSNFNSVNNNSNRERTLEKLCGEVGLNNNRTAITKTCTDEPTVKDLLKIIQQQNEQLLILQKQVSQLIEFQTTQQIEKQRPIVGPEVTEYYSQRQTNVFGDVLPCERREEFKPQDKGPLSKFAIGVTTSFEVSVMRQQNLDQRNKFKNYMQQEAKIQEVTHGGENKKVCDASRSIGDSLILNDHLPVREDCPSPVNSIHVDMNDYSSESDDDSSCSSSNIDWTLYNNIMDQVNNILRKAQKSSGDNAKLDGKYKDETMKKVMEATIKQLKSMGINLSNTNGSENYQSTPDNQKNYTSSEISFAVKQLLMKHLPPEQLAKVACVKTGSSSSGNSEEMVDLVKKKPEFSFDTLQYMKKYNLIRTSDGMKSAEPKPKSRNNVCPKILDISTLKQQPKLM